MLARFSASVTRSGGRTVDVHPARQIVSSILVCVTAGFSAPGVHVGSGREDGPVPSAWHDPGAGWAWTTSLPAVETASCATGGILLGAGAGEVVVGATGGRELAVAVRVLDGGETVVGAPAEDSAGAGLMGIGVVAVPVAPHPDTAQAAPTANAAETTVLVSLTTRAGGP